MNKSEMSRKRNLINQTKYFKRQNFEITQSVRKIQNARIRKGLYKPFFEEFNVLIDYANLKYEDKEHIYCKWVGAVKRGKNINYDGEIYFKNELIEKLEITCPLRSRFDKNTAIQLNERGFTDVEVGKLETILDENNFRIIEKVKDKNNKTTYDETISLLVYMEDFMHYFIDVKMCEDKVNELVADLKKIDYKFKNVYLIENIFMEKVLVRIK